MRVADPGRTDGFVGVVLIVVFFIGLVIGSFLTGRTIRIASREPPGAFSQRTRY
jgi:hypothetical protein